MGTIREGAIVTRAECVDAGMIFICQDDNYHVHIFQNPEQLVHHGKIIPITAFNHRNRLIRPPDARLIKWHYNQCLIKRFRTFSVTRADLDLRLI